MTDKPRRPPHFKIFTSAKNHAKLGQVFQNNALLSLYVRLGIEAIERYADRNGDTFIIGDREIVALSGIGRADQARKSLERLAEVSPISAERDGDVWLIHWPNLQQKQFNRVSPSTSTSSSASASSKTKKKVQFPDPFPTKDGQSLIAWGKTQNLSASEVRRGIHAVRDWALAGDHRRKDWEAAIRNGIRRGWALEASQGAPEREIPRGQAYRSMSDPERQREQRERLEEIVAGLTECQREAYLAEVAAGAASPLALRRARAGSGE